MLLKDKVAIITGGSMGIGQGIARRFADEGCSVVITDISDDEGEKTADEITKKGQKAIYVHCDVTKEKEVIASVKKAVDTFGKVDILVASAGGIPGFKGESIEETTEEMWDKIVNLNLKGLFFCNKAVIPYMKAKKYGKIVNISSLGAVAPPAPIMHYHAAKGGVLSLTYNLAQEVARFNITVNCILPGPVRTPFWKPVTVGVEDVDGFFNNIAKVEVPLQRVGTPDDIAGGALFYATDLSSYVTGDRMLISGGIPLTVIKPKD
jgi:NAD(P)-dependent dehydrogenase (short-subunit alcohol dehydrogenase family)